DDVIEVVAQFDGSIIDVQHLVPPPPDARAQANRTRALVVGGGAALGLALLLFFVSAHVMLPRAFDLVVTLLLSAGTWLLLRGLGRATVPSLHEYTVGEDASTSCAVAPGALPLSR